MAGTVRVAKSDARPSLGQLSSRLCTCGVRQGSALGPMLFIIYTAELVSVVESHGLYADDTYVYCSCSPASVDDFSSRISECRRCFQLNEVQQVVTELRQNRTSVMRIR